MQITVKYATPESSAIDLLDTDLLNVAIHPSQNSSQVNQIQAWLWQTSNICYVNPQTRVAQCIDNE